MMKLNAWPVLLAAPVLLALVTAYPHRAEILKGYREELDGPATEKSGRHIDGLGGGHLLRDTWNLDNPPCRQRRGGLDSLSGATFGGAKKRFNSLSGAAFGTAKRNFDEIDRTPFNSFTKKNFDEIDRAGFNTFVKRVPEVDDFPIYNMPVIPRVASLFPIAQHASVQEDSQ